MEKVITFSIVIFIILLLLGICYFYFNHAAVYKRKLKRFAKKSIMMCKDGDMVRLSGLIELISPALKSPLTKRECVYYQVLVEEKSSNHYTDVIRDDKAIDFIISDGSMKAYISTRNISCNVYHDMTYQSGFLNNPTPALENYLKRNRIASVGFFGFNKSMRYYEGIISTKEIVTVAGKVKWVPSTKVGINSTENILLITAVSHKKPLYLSNDREHQFI